VRVSSILSEDLLCPTTRYRLLRNSSFFIIEPSYTLNVTVKVLLALINDNHYPDGENGNQVIEIALPSLTSNDQTNIEIQLPNLEKIL
jgi:hypothetical protein